MEQGQEQEEIEVMSLADLAELEFMRLYSVYDIANAPEKRKADIIDSLWPDIYKAVFKPGAGDVRFNNTKSKLKTYDVAEVEEVVNKFIVLNKRYGGVIKFNQFANMTGINRYTLYLWHKANNTNGYIFNLNNNDMEEENKYIYIICDNEKNTGDIAVKEYRGNASKLLNGNILTSKRFDVIKKLQEEMQDSNTNGLSNDTMGQALRANNEDELGKLYEPRRMIQHEQIRVAISANELPKLSDNSTQLLPDNQEHQDAKDTQLSHNLKT